MAKRKFKLTEVERKELLKAYQASKDAGTRTRYQAVRLYGEGYAEKEIEQIIHKDWWITELVATVPNWANADCAS